MSRRTLLNSRVGLVDADARYFAKPTTRTGHLVLGSPIGTAAAATTDQSFRTLVRLGSATSRWRIGFANRNLRSNTTLTTPCTITGVFTGTPVYGTTSASGARWTGSATGTMPSVSGAITVPTDGTVGWSNWITAGASQFAAFTEKVIAWGHTNTNTGTGWAVNNSGGYQTYSATGSSQAANATLSPVSLGTNIWLDVIIQYEFLGTGETGLFIGDSNTFGVSTSAPPLFSTTGSGTLPHESWPNVAAELAGFSAINFGVGSTTLADFATGGFAGLWTRVDLTTLGIDFAVVSLGTNGLVSNQANFDNFVTYIRSINTQLRALGIKRIYWTDITPRAATAQTSSFSASTTVGATTFQTPVQLTFNDGQACCVLGSGTEAEFVTVASTTPTGSGPYTYTIAASGTLANAHTAGDVITCGSEAARRRINAWLRNMPDGISALIPFEQSFEASPLSPNCDPRLVCTDGLHFVRGAGMQRAAIACVTGVQFELT